MDSVPDSRRRFLARVPAVAMMAGLAASYGTLLAYFGRFLFPASGRREEWLFVTRVSGIARGQTVLYKTPAGESVNVTRRGAAGTSEDFVALSSVCPHLGCQVHWEPQNNRYFCPCHNGVFRPDGVAIGGPPAEAGQSLSAYPLRLRDGLLFIRVPTEKLSVGARAELRGKRGAVIEVAGDGRGPGHDPCLGSTFGREEA